MTIDEVGQFLQGSAKRRPQVWCIFLLLWLTTHAWLCLQHSCNMGTIFYPSAVQDGQGHLDEPQVPLLGHGNEIDSPNLVHRDYRTRNRK